MTPLALSKKITPPRETRPEKMLGEIKSGAVRLQGGVSVFGRGVPSRMTSFNPLRVLNRNGYDLAFSMLVPSCLAQLVLNRSGCCMFFSMPVPSRLTSLTPELVLNRSGYHIAFNMPVPSPSTSLKPKRVLK